MAQKFRRDGNYKHVILDAKTTLLLVHAKIKCLKEYPEKKISDKFVVHVALKNFVGCENGK